MIKINLLPSYILEARRVKAVIALMALVVLGVAALLGAYVWAPAPWSLSSQDKLATDELTRVTGLANQVQQLQSETTQIKAQYGEKQKWVQWVADANRLPAMWVRYYQMLNKYIPADVVVNGLPAPNGGNLQLSGTTSDQKAAARWYLNMLRCEIAGTDPGSVMFNTATVGWPGDLPRGENPKMATQVSISMVIRQDALTMLTQPSMPAGIGGGGMGGRGGGRMGGGGRGGGRMGGGGGRGGGGRGGGGGMRGGGGRGRG